MLSTYIFSLSKISTATIWKLCDFHLLIFFLQFSGGKFFKMPKTASWIHTYQLIYKWTLTNLNWPSTKPQWTFKVPILKSFFQLQPINPQWTNPRTSNHLPRHLIWKIYLPSHVFKNCSNICWHCYKYKLLHVVNLLILRRPWKTRLKIHSVQRCWNNWISNFNNPGKARMRPRTRHMA